MAELLHCLEKSNKSMMKEQHRVLFLGKSCYPLSPDKDSTVDVDGTDGNEELKISSKDQLKQICRVMGKPTEHDKSFITEESAIEYLDLTVQHKHRNKLETLFPSADAETLTLLRGLLEFNPYYRLSAK